MSEKRVYTDKEIIADIQAGGIKGRRMTEWVFDQYAGFVANGSKKFRLSIEDTRDVYADAIVAMNRHISLGNFRGESKVKTYLYSIFLNRCKNKLRDLGRKKVHWIDEMPDMPERARNMLERMIQQDELGPIKRALVALGESCRRIIWEREYYGYSLEEIAQRIGFSSVKSVSSKKAACLKKLRELLTNTTKT